MKFLDVLNCFLNHKKKFKKPWSTGCTQSPYTPILGRILKAYMVTSKKSTWYISSKVCYSALLHRPL